MDFGVCKVPEMETKKPETHMTSAVAFVEGGIQDSYDDACSICLEEFCESDPSTVDFCCISYNPLFFARPYLDLDFYASFPFSSA